MKERGARAQPENRDNSDCTFGISFFDGCSSISFSWEFENGFLEEHLLPLCIFDNSALSGLEAVTKFLKEVSGLKFKEISLLLERNQKTIWGAYNSSRKKYPLSFSNLDGGFFVPSSIFRDRRLGVLEAISLYLHDSLNLKYSQIARLLRRDDRTIWTSYQRGLRKKNGNGVKK